MQRGAEGLLSKGDKGVGVDIEPVSTFADVTAKQEFINRNFTAAEQSYAAQSSDPSSTYAGRWAAKEAVVKAISSTRPDVKLTQGDDAALIDIEVLTSSSGAQPNLLGATYGYSLGTCASGAPVVEVHGHAAEVMKVLGITDIKVSISHSAEVAIAQAIAR